MATLGETPVSPSDHRWIVRHLQQLTGLNLPVDYINRGSHKAAFEQRYAAGHRAVAQK